MNTGCRTIAASGRPPPARSAADGGGTCTPRLHGHRHQRDRREHQERAQERRAEQVLGRARRLRVRGIRRRRRPRAPARSPSRGRRARRPRRRRSGTAGRTRCRRRSAPVATQYSAKLPSHSASAARQAADDVDRGARHEAAAAADAAHPQRRPASPPARNRGRRSSRPASRASGRARARSRRAPFIEIRPAELTSSSAWQQASRKRSRREVCTCGERGEPGYSGGMPIYAPVLRPDAAALIGDRCATTSSSSGSVRPAASRIRRGRARFDRGPAPAARDAWFRKDPAFDDDDPRALRRRGRGRAGRRATPTGARPRRRARPRAAARPVHPQPLSRHAARVRRRRAGARHGRGGDRRRARPRARPLRALVPATCRSSTARTPRCRSARWRCSARWPRPPATARPLEWAEKHAAVIRRFGRYPHRNAILGRASTAERRRSCASPGSRF